VSGLLGLLKEIRRSLLKKGFEMMIFGKSTK
jgi:hypothetical protein